jgi:cell division protein FtsQ
MPRKKSNRRIQRKPKQKPVLKIELPQINWGRIANVLALSVVLMGSYNGTLWLMDRPIEMVRVEGAFERVSSPQVEAAMSGYLDKGFLAVDIKKLQAEIANLPWVRSATVQRSWPNSLQVKVAEEQVAARWGKSGLVNLAGDLFVEDATHIPAELPRLNGPDGTHQEVAALFFELRARLEQVGLVAVALEQDARGAWELQTSSGMRVRFGAMNIAERIDRFFVALEQVLTPVADQVDYVDMRYTNGFAIGWKAQGETRLADLMENDPHA